MTGAAAGPPPAAEPRVTPEADVVPDRWTMQPAVEPRAAPGAGLHDGLIMRA